MNLPTVGIGAVRISKFYFISLLLLILINSLYLLILFILSLLLLVIPFPLWAPLMYYFISSLNYAIVLSNSAVVCLLSIVILINLVIISRVFKCYDCLLAGSQFQLHRCSRGKTCSSSWYLTALVCLLRCFSCFRFWWN